MNFTEDERARIEQDIRSNWSGNRMRDLAAYFLTPYQELADQIWHQESQVRADRYHAARKAKGC